MRIDWHSAKGLAFVTVLALLLVPTGGLAEDNPVVGTWRLKSFFREIAPHSQLGTHVGTIQSLSSFR